MSTKFQKPNQIIQPYEYGDEAQKSTCLWLKNLPNLVPTNIVGKGEFVEWTTKEGKKKRMPKWFSQTKGDRSTYRSKTFMGIAKAMASQWTKEN